MALLVVFDVALAFDRKHVTCPKKPLARKLLGVTNVPFFSMFFVLGGFYQLQKCGPLH